MSTKANKISMDERRNRVAVGEWWGPSPGSKPGDNRAQTARKIVAVDARNPARVQVMMDDNRRLLVSTLVSQYVPCDPPPTAGAQQELGDGEEREATLDDLRAVVREEVERAAMSFLHGARRDHVVALVMEAIRATGPVRLEAAE